METDLVAEAADGAWAVRVAVWARAAGAAAFIFGDDDERNMAEVFSTYSWTTDTPDFWRREYMHYPRHGSRFTGEPAYFRTSMSSAKGIMEMAGVEPGDFGLGAERQIEAAVHARAESKLEGCRLDLQRSEGVGAG